MAQRPVHEAPRTRTACAAPGRSRRRSGTMAAAGPGRGVFRPHAERRTARVRHPGGGGSCWSAVRAVGRAGDEQPGSSAVAGEVARCRLRSATSGRDAARTAPSSSAAAAVTSTRRPSPTSVATASARGRAVVLRISTRIAAPTVAAFGGLRCAGVLARGPPVPRRGDQAGWGRGGRDVRRICPGPSRWPHPARSGEPFDENSETVAPSARRRCRPGPAHQFHLRGRRHFTAMVTLVSRQSTECCTSKGLPGNVGRRNGHRRRSPLRQ
jgi:hypothetical protein